MANRIQFLIDKLSLDPKKLFWIDSSGAFFSALSLGFMAVVFQKHIGMPQQVLLFSSAIAGVYALYSLCCYLFVVENWRPYLKFIAFANLAYCGLTIGLIIYYYQQLTNLGLIYFFSELLIMIILVGVELMTVFKRR